MHDDFVRRLKTSNISEYRMTDAKELKGAWKAIQIMKSLSQRLEKRWSGVDAKLRREDIEEKELESKLKGD